LRIEKVRRRFDIDERALPAGVRLMTRTALELLSDDQQTGH